ncbi:phage tail protein [Sphingomonas hengshuiensis]|uniref:Tail collar protein n=1 Tax=Sphingomonas hengshuiensis TaxID=1609977 RepID=A0A7U4LFK5_9SPHN|nr:tail fiber protein [Sphingomonas hengshuiensis]AJP72624.1 tail collar protein [Sphingomonas hengshuiensis]
MDPYIGEIRLYPYVRGAPSGWQLCDGSLLAISEYDALYTLLGTTYGGNGSETFAVPDLRGAVPIHQGTGPGLSHYVLGQKAGTEEVTLTTQQMPAHNHMVVANNQPATLESPSGALLAGGIVNDPFYTTNVAQSTPQPLSSNAIQHSGGSGAHPNCAPTLALNYCIALFGIYPIQS